MNHINENLLKLIEMGNTPYIDLNEFDLLKTATETAQQLKLADDAIIAEVNLNIEDLKAKRLFILLACRYYTNVGKNMINV